MSAKFTPKETIRVIEKDGLLREVMAMKSRGMRLSQACASYKDGKYELSYSFADDETMDYETLRVVCGLADRIPSIHDFYSCASFYENEMRELFGVKIELIEPDYHNKLYRIKAETPFLPEDAKAEQKKQEQEISLAALTATWTVRRLRRTRSLRPERRRRSDGRKREEEKRRPVRTAASGSSRADPPGSCSRG